MKINTTFAAVFGFMFCYEDFFLVKFIAYSLTCSEFLLSNQIISFRI